mmetsp:Transcript_43039/g.168471  ORF Transcript_43039/g.168471 Transcript_43039/m.168471 type:complete len:205 (+) Transcript_43039:3078-3692(+)
MKHDGRHNVTVLEDAQTLASCGVPEADCRIHRSCKQEVLQREKPEKHKQALLRRRKVERCGKWVDDYRLRPVQINNRLRMTFKDSHRVCLKEGLNLIPVVDDTAPLIGVDNVINDFEDLDNWRLSTDGEVGSRLVEFHSPDGPAKTSEPLPEIDVLERSSAWGFSMIHRLCPSDILPPIGPRIPLLRAAATAPHLGLTRQRAIR